MKNRLLLLLARAWPGAMVPAAASGLISKECMARLHCRQVDGDLLKIQQDSRRPWAIRADKACKRYYQPGFSSTFAQNDAGLSVAVVTLCRFTRTCMLFLAGLRPSGTPHFRFHCAGLHNSRSLRRITLRHGLVDQCIPAIDTRCIERWACCSSGVGQYGGRRKASV